MKFPFQSGAHNHCLNAHLGCVSDNCAWVLCFPPEREKHRTGFTGSASEACRFGRIPAEERESLIL